MKNKTSRIHKVCRWTWRRGSEFKQNETFHRRNMEENLLNVLCPILADKKMLMFAQA